MSLVLVTFLAIQIQQWILRWRAKRLMADVHQIRLYQTTWADGQRLMHRWGAWGHYDGSCTAASCKYEIEMGSIASNIPSVPRYAWLDWLLRHDRFNLYEWLGGRSSAVHASFTVHDGTIWRESSWIGVSVPSRRIRKENDFEWSLSVGAESYQRLHRTLKNPFLFMGGVEGLAGHPYYKVGRPDGCMILCQIIVAYYSTHTPPAEIERLTAYNFSCFTRFSPCMHVADLLPAAQEWHLYDSQYESGPTVPKPKERPLSDSWPKPVPCSNIPVWAMARDARYILTVEALSTKIQPGKHPHEVAKVRVVNSLKEPAPWLPGAIVDAEQFYSGEAEPLIAGRRYIMFAIGNDSRRQMITKDSPIRFDQCGVLEDRPEIHRELEKGFAQNDTLNP